MGICEINAQIYASYKDPYTPVLRCAYMQVSQITLYTPARRGPFVRMASMYIHHEKYPVPEKPFSRQKCKVARMAALSSSSTISTPSFAVSACAYSACYVETWRKGKAKPLTGNSTRGVALYKRCSLCLFFSIMPFLDRLQSSEESLTYLKR